MQYIYTVYIKYKHIYICVHVLCITCSFFFKELLCCKPKKQPALSQKYKVDENLGSNLWVV